MDRKLKISQNFGQQRVNYHKTAFLQKKIAQKLASLLPPLQPATILEIGCGTGFLTTHLIDQYPDSHLQISDLSSEMLEFTKERSFYHKDIIFEILDGENMPLTYTQKFDLIATSMTIQWFSNPLESVEKLLSCLKPNGILLYTTLGSDNFPEWTQSLKDLSFSSGLLQHTPLPGQVFSDKVTIPHHSALDFLKSLKQQGAQLAHHNYQPLKTGQMLTTLQYMDKHYQSHTWHIIYGAISPP